MSRLIARDVEESVVFALDQAFGSHPAPGGDRPLVFLVDDDPFLRTLVGDWVEAAGYRTLRLADGVSCLAALARERPVAVILDLHMEGLSGRETLDFIRTADPTLPVVAMTADDDPRAAIDLIDRGADDFLQKPVTPRRLARTLQAVSGRVRLLVPA